jgi:hypothetical protein
MVFKREADPEFFAPRDWREFEKAAADPESGMRYSSATGTYCVSITRKL